MVRGVAALAVVAAPAFAFPLTNDDVDGKDLPWTWFRLTDANKGKTCAQMHTDTLAMDPDGAGNAAAADKEKYVGNAWENYSAGGKGWYNALMGSLAVADNGCSRAAAPTGTDTCSTGYGSNGINKYHTGGVEAAEMTEAACQVYMKFYTKNQTALQKPSSSPGAEPRCVDEWKAGQTSSIIHWKQYDEVGAAALATSGVAAGGMYAVCCKSGRAADCNTFKTLCNNTHKSMHRTWADTKRIYSATNNTCTPEYDS